MENNRRNDCRRIKDNCLQVFLWVGSTVLMPPFVRNSAVEARPLRNTFNDLKVTKTISVNGPKCFSNRRVKLWNNLPTEAKEHLLSAPSKFQQVNLHFVSLLSSKIFYCICDLLLCLFFFQSLFHMILINFILYCN